MRRFLNPFFGLLLLALALAAMHAWQGISTDEAKYLLNIPYPHPPLARGIIGFTRFIPGQEWIWRVLLAAMLLQAMWLVRTFAPAQERGAALLFGGLWVLSASVFVSAGQILLAPVTAVEMLVFCYWYLHDDGLERMIGWVALFWLVSLFTAYQAILFIPVVAAVIWRMRQPRWQRILALGGPVALLALYTLANPLAVASMITAGGQNLGAGSVLQALRGVGWLWVLGGSAVLSLLGTIGMLASRRWPLIFSLLLVVAFILLSYRPYYGILFTPLFIAGIASSPALLRRRGMTLLAALACAFVLVPVAFPKSSPSPVAAVYDATQRSGIPGGATTIISGSFGHEWQYGPYEVRRMIGNPQLLDSARVAVCLSECPAIHGREGWEQLKDVPVETWVRPIR